MSFIAIDISLDNFNLLIGNKSKIIFSKTEKVYKDRSNILFETLHYIQNEKIFDFKNIEKIYSTIGPGNYNGIRISISTIKALNLVYKKLDISGISSLDALIRSQAVSDKNSCAVIKSSPGYLYTQWYDKFLNPISNIEILSLENKIKLPVEKTSFRLIGNGSEELAMKLNYKISINNNNIITPKGLWHSVNNLINNNTNINPEPLYLRSDNIVKPSFWKKAPSV